MLDFRCDGVDQIARVAAFILIYCRGFTTDVESGIVEAVQGEEVEVDVLNVGIGWSGVNHPEFTKLRNNSGGRH